jgi:hypothetical protein
MAIRFNFEDSLRASLAPDRSKGLPNQFQQTREYGDYLTFPLTSAEWNIPEINQNPTVANPRTLNRSTSYQSVLGPIFTGVYDASWKQQWDSEKIEAVYYTPAGAETYGEAAISTQAGTLYTNKTALKTTGGIANQAIRSSLTFLGFPSSISYVNQVYDTIDNLGDYSTTPLSQRNNKYLGTPLPYLDFRARKTTIFRFIGQGLESIAIGSVYGQTAGFGINPPNTPNAKIDVVNLIDRRYDGASAGLRGSGRAIAIAATNTTTGPYTVFNLDTLYGFGQQDDPYAIRNDYTLRSSIGNSAASTKNTYRKALTYVESVIPFRGDRVNVVDYKKRTWNNVYQWQETDIDFKSEKLKSLRNWTANAFDAIGLSPLGTTKDLINFFFTGPKLYAGGDPNATDWVLVFRALLTSFSDQFSPSWTQLNMVGRADPNYQYGGFSRDIDLGFSVYASDRDELKFIYRKLNYLAGMTMPEYKQSSKSVVAPWLRITVGDLLVSQAVVINSLSYTFVDADTTWEINFEDDPEMMQVPHKVDISLGLHLVGNQLPEKDGSAYSLTKKFNKDGIPNSEDSAVNWLHDSKTSKRAARAQGVFIAEDISNREVEK